MTCNLIRSGRLESRPAKEGRASTRSGASKLCVALAFGALLSGCSIATSSEPYQSLSPIEVSLEPKTLELAPNAALGDTQRLQVAAFARRFARNGEGDITVAYPSDAPAASFVDDVLEEITRQGVSTSRLETGPYSREADGDRGVVVFFMAPTALGSGCERLWGETAINLHNEKSRRLGCAYRTNLAAMVADPRDLLTPRAMTPADLERRRGVFDLYRAGEETVAEGSEQQIQTTD